MDGIRRTLSFRKKKKKSEAADGSKPPQWLEDESKIKEGCCSFHVRYLGNIEVYESRGMQVCEEAIRALRKSKKKPQKAILYVSGDALRVSDDVSQHLIVDQTIEKVSFCAPDRNHEKGFAYICRDGATRRWMCHAFLAVRESGERLSHAVGCAFAICLEKKQKREREALQLAASDDRPFSRTGSVRTATLAERLLDPQSAITPTIPANSGDNIHPSIVSSSNTVASAAQSPFPANSLTGAIPRPRPSSSILERQGSLRMFPKLQDASPFKRDLSLRLADLPSNLQRLTRTMNGHTIPEENDSELDDPLQSAKRQMPDDTTPSSSMQPPDQVEPTTVMRTTNQLLHHVCQPASSSLPTYSTVLSSQPSVVPLTFGPAADFIDPFSAAPFNSTMIQQRLDQMTISNPIEVNPLPQQSTSSQLTAQTDINRLVSSAWFNSSRPTDFLQASAINTSPILRWSCSTVSVPSFPASAGTQYVHPFTRAQAITHLTWTNSFPIDRTSVITPYSGMGTYSPLRAASWIPDSALPPEVWCPPLPSLLPPEPDRFADPFDVGWADRATAPVITSTTHKPGNPFFSTPPPTITAGAEGGGGASAVTSLV